MIVLELKNFKLIISKPSNQLNSWARISERWFFYSCTWHLRTVALIELQIYSNFHAFWNSGNCLEVTALQIRRSQKPITWLLVLIFVPQFFKTTILLIFELIIINCHMAFKPVYTCFTSQANKNMKFDKFLVEILVFYTYILLLNFSNCKSRCST